MADVGVRIQKLEAERGAALAEVASLRKQLAEMVTCEATAWFQRHEDGRVEAWVMLLSEVPPEPGKWYDPDLDWTPVRSLADLDGLKFRPLYVAVAPELLVARPFVRGELVTFYVSPSLLADGPTYDFIAEHYTFDPRDHPALAEDCPFCEAASGEMCTDGKEPVDEPHSDRLRLFPGSSGPWE